MKLSTANFGVLWSGEYRRQKMSGLAFLALLSGNSLVSQAVYGQTTAPHDTELQEIVVTGSLIRRTDAETPSPVQVITAEDLTKSGYTTVSDVLRNLSANGAGTLSQSFNSSFAGGGSGVALRGLSVGGTLTLIDGHRMVGYPLTDDGQRNFVDVTAIPFNAVERVEVLKDGASSEYGSDAIAGVVNIILKKTYTGAEISVEGGTSAKQDGTLEHISTLMGTGDLASDKYNVYVTAEFRKQDAIGFYSRNGAFNVLDYRGVGGVNTTPGAGSNPFGNGGSGYPASLTGYLINPGATGPAQAFLPGCSSTAQLADQCTFRDAGLQIQPPTQSMNILTKFTVNLGDNWQSITTASVFQTKAQQAGPAYASTAYPSGSEIIGLPPGGLPNVQIYPVITVPASYPNNPYGAAAPLVYNFGEVGYPYTQYKTNTYRLVEDVNGTVAGWDVGASAGYMYAILDQVSFGAIEPGALQDALNSGGYILGSSTGASRFAPTAEATDASYLMYGNVHGSHKLMALPGGDLALAVGAEYFEKKLNAPAAATSVSAIQGGLNDAYALGSQADTAGFLELNAPIFKNLEANAALRYDHYNTAAGGSTTPKFGVKYTPIPQLAIRGTWGKGFRAPSIPESNSGAAFGAGSVPDPVLCPTADPKAPGTFPSQCAVQLVGVQSGNPALKPEKTTTYTFGVIVEPSKSFSASVDYYDIKVNQDIISAFQAGGLGVGPPTTYLRLGPTVSEPQVQADGSIANAQTPVPLITYKPFPYINASQDETNGVDLDLRGQLDFGDIGHLTAQLSVTHIMSFKLQAAGTTYQLAGTHGPSGISGDTGNPKDRGTLSLTWAVGALSVTGNLNYISGFSVVDPSAGQPTCDTAVYNNATLEFGNKFQQGNAYPGSYCRVGSFTDVDFYGQYSVNEHLQLHASVVNAFDKPPPFDSVTYGGAGGGAYSAGLAQVGAVGRYFTIGGIYKF